MEYNVAGDNLYTVILHFFPSLIPIGKVQVRFSKCFSFFDFHINEFCPV